MKNVVFCGGHLSPALAVIERLLKKKKYQIFYLGRKYALEGDKAYSLEYLTIKKAAIPFKSVTTARLQRSFTLYTLPSFLKLPIGVVQSFFLLLAIRPKVVISFGSYVAFPICLSAWFLRIPIITHEQTHVLGLSNKFISRFASVLCLSFKNTKGIAKNVKTVYTGNPIRESILVSKSNKKIEFGNNKLPLIYVTGGSLGSQSINEIMKKVIPLLCTHFRILHQCGNASGGKDYQDLLKIQSSLPARLFENYNLVKQIDPSDLGTIYRNAQLIISRAGANTVAEILTLGTPAILIPLPWAGQNEQEKNARYVESIGLGKVIKQKELTSDYLLQTIDKIFSNITYYRQNAKQAKKMIVKDGALKIAKLIDAYCV